MRLADLCVIFASLFLCCAVVQEQQVRELGVVANVQRTYKLALEAGTERAVERIAEWEDGQETAWNREEVSETFFRTLAEFMGRGEKDERIRWWYEHIPLILYMEQDGVSADTLENGRRICGEKYYYETEIGSYRVRYTLDDYVKVYAGEELVGEGFWRDLQPFFRFEEWEDDFEIHRRNCIQAVVLDLAKKTLSEQDLHQNRFSTDYELTAKALEHAVWNGETERLSMLVFYRDSPYGNQMTGYYDRIAAAGAGWRKGAAYEDQMVSFDDDSVSEYNVVPRS